MYHSLLVPLDGSASGEHALPPALSIARRCGAALRVVRVHVPSHEVVDRVLQEIARAYLDGVVKRLAAIVEVPVSADLQNGPVAEAINREAAIVGADLLVMTTHGRGTLARMWLSSVADALVRQASIPILLVRSQESAPDFTQEQAFRRILIPLDGTDLAEQVLESALALGDSTQAEYTLLRVVAPMAPPSDDSVNRRISGIRESLLKQLQELDRQQWTEAQGYLEGLAVGLRARSLTVQTHVAPHEQPAAAILDYASSHGSEAIAVATRGRGGLKRLVLGSVADKVVRGAAIPLLVYPPVDRSAPAAQRT